MDRYRGPVCFPCGLTLGLLLVSAVLVLPAGPARSALPVGYDHPESAEGGPTIPQGEAWIEKVWPRRIVCAGKLPGGPLRVVMLVNRGGLAEARALTHYLPLEATVVEPHGEGDFRFVSSDFEETRRLLLSGQHIDAFLVSRIDAATIPYDIVYEILSRVKNEGSGLVLQDQWGSNPLHPNSLGLKPLVPPNKQLLPGLPYEGLQQVAHEPGKTYPLAKLTVYPGWSAKPYEFGEVGLYQFGRGSIIYYTTNTTIGNMYWGTPAVIPGIEITRDMWAQTDYLYSHTAKALLRASGRPQAVQITGMQPRGETDGSQPAELSVVAPGGAFTGTLRWQIRDQWGIVTTHGKQPCQATDQGVILRLQDVTFAHAGRQFVDVWLDNAAGETVDWGSTFVEVNRGLAPPKIQLKFPDRTPRGEPLEGSVVMEDAPAGTTLRLTLVDRFWREVGRLTGPADAPLRFSFPAGGLAGQIWFLQADALDPAGHLLSRAHTEIRSPKTKADFGAWTPAATTYAHGTIEMSAYQEMIRQLGYVANRSGSLTPLGANAALWNDLQNYPTPWHITALGDDAPMNDWEEPALREEMRRSLQEVCESVKPWGVWGMNLTDDSGAYRQLPRGAYSAIKFYEWLQTEYGDFDAVCEAWGWTPPEEEVADEDLPQNPYVQVAFHQWLQKKYGSLEDLAKAWKVTLGQWANLHQRMVQLQRDKGNRLPTEDVTAFKQQFAGNADTDNPFARITNESIKAAYDAGQTAAWIDAQRFCQKLWVGDMDFVCQAMREVIPDAYAGTDAAYYGYSAAEAFGRLNYVCPYYGHVTVKLGAQRGRMTQPGLYGACLGTYGGKPANLAVRRNPIWDCLLSGGTGYVFWCFWNGNGITFDYKLQDAHALYQTEVNQELDSGIGDLVAGCPPAYAPVAMLYSLSSGTCDQLEAKHEPVTSHGLSWDAFLAAFEDLGLYPYPIISEELEGGFLQKHGIKLLALPGCNALSDKEIQVVRDFVNAGGVVLADVLPGRRTPCGVVRPQPPLADLFGVEFTPEGPEEKARLRGVLSGRPAPDTPEVTFGEALGDPRVKATTATVLGHVGESPALLERTFGKGQAVLFNCSFSSYATWRAEGGEPWLLWHQIMLRLAGAAGVPRPFPWTSEGKPTPGFRITNFPNGKGYLLGVQELGSGDFTGPRRPLEIALPEAFHVYDVRAGKHLGQVTTLKTDLPRGGVRIYSLMPYQVKSLDLRADKTSLAGAGTVTLTANLNLDPATRRDRHVLRVEATDPQRQSFYPFQRVLEAPPAGPVRVPLTFALNDTPGVWRITVTDVNSGAGATVTVQLKGEKQP